jgi:DGQHR domain-containing protein
VSNKKVSTAPTRKRATPRQSTKKSAEPHSGKVGQAPKLKDIFEGAGFNHVPADGVHFTVGGRTGELDHIFVWENVVLLCEETAGKDATKHCTNKIYLHSKIAGHWSTGFFTEYTKQNPGLLAALGTKYQIQDLEVRHIYYSEDVDVIDSVGDPAPMRILSRAQARYFASLVETICRSAKFELLKFLGIALHQVGDARVSGRAVASDSFPAFALPAAHTSYPAGFTVASFYADPMALIQRAYVMRRDGWEDPDLSYQRFVRAEKLLEMREYLGNNGKVFINNLIVTLPATALLLAESGKPLDPDTMHHKTNVKLSLPLELGTVGIVDGQHRILSYYEGSGELDQKISSLRQRQNLLVTGIIFPPNYTPEMRVKFEAEIFLGINNNQSSVHTQLRQDLETIINPETPLAIARAIVTRLSKEGALAGLLQMSQFDPSDKIASGSLGPYVITPLIRKNSAFYKTWDGVGARDLNNADDRSAYTDYCVQELKRLLAGASENLKEKWRSVPNGGVLSTTTVGGLLLLLGRLAKGGAMLSQIDYKMKLKHIGSIDFSAYTGSSWGKLSNKLYEVL